MFIFLSAVKEMKTLLRLIGKNTVTLQIYNNKQVTHGYF